MRVVLPSVVIMATLVTTTSAAEWVPTDADPYMARNTVMAPMRAVFEWLGAEVVYEASTRTIVAHQDDIEIRLRARDGHALVNGQQRGLAAPVAVRDGRTFVPLRFVSEALGAQVDWDGSSRTVTVYQAGRAGQLSVPVDALRSRQPTIMSVPRHFDRDDWDGTPLHDFPVVQPGPGHIW